MTTAFQFSLQNQLGRTYTLQSFAGRWLVLYFYPKDDTPGCTAEACSIRDSYQDLLNLGADVVGISKDTTKSHEKFAQKHGLQFSLLSDPTGSTIKAYGAWGKTMVGVKGILR
ncbi:MAG TPA: peroxiredoxin, partial [Candidatus Saccharimonadia bacterium]